MGRDELSFGEIQRMIYAENLLSAFASLRKSLNWAEWATSNPKLARMIEDAKNAVSS